LPDGQPFSKDLGVIRSALPQPWRTATSRSGAITCVALFALAAASCKGGNPSTAPPAGSGTLIVAVTPPGETIVVVDAIGPSGYEARFSHTDTLGSLAAGAYTITTANAASNDPVVNSLYGGQVTGSPATIAGTDTLSASVTYSLLPGTGGLWVGSTNAGAPVAAEFTSTELLGHSAPSLSLPVVDADEVFDAAGNLWIASLAGNTVTEYPASQLVAGTPVSSVTIGGSGLSGPGGLAFDRDGNLWVANFTGNTVAEYTASQLAVSGSPAPAVTVSGAALDNPAHLTFDVTGNLWVPNAGANTVVEYTAAQIASSGSPTQR
jgi:ligand-binding sensor domain-containing protein